LAPWRPSWGPLGGSWEALGSLLGGSWVLLGASWDPLGASWGPSWDDLGALGRLSGPLEAVGKPFGRSWKPFGSPKGSQKVPQIDPRGTKNHDRNVSRFQSLATCIFSSLWGNIFMKLKNVEKTSTLQKH